MKILNLNEIAVVSGGVQESLIPFPDYPTPWPTPYPSPWPWPTPGPFPGPFPQPEPIFM